MSTASKTRSNRLPKIGAALQARREELKLTQAGLARLSDVHEITIANIERDARTPSLFALAKLCKVMDLNLDIRQYAPPLPGGKKK